MNVEKWTNREIPEHIKTFDPIDQYHVGKTWEKITAAWDVIVTLEDGQELIITRDRYMELLEQGELTLPARYDRRRPFASTG